jgi:hypothetical protein
MKTETLRGVALVHKIRELESQNKSIRRISVGQTNAEWIIEWDEPAVFQTEILAEPWKKETGTALEPASYRGGNLGGRDAGSHSPGPPDFSGRERPAGNQ